MVDIINALQDRINEKLTWLNGQIDEDYGQVEMMLEDDEDHYPIASPSCFISVDDMSFTSFAGAAARVQQCNLTITVKLLIDCYDDTHYRSGTADKIKERMQKVHEMHSALQGFKIGAGILDRTSGRFQTLARGLKLYQYSYVLRQVIEKCD